MPRFAILRHDWPKLHWDFLLEAGPVLRAWRLLSQPKPGQLIVAESLPDHRLIYLEFEGELSGDRGSASRWDVGTFEWAHDEPDAIGIRMGGERIRGLVTMKRRDGEEWTWRFEEGYDEPHSQFSSQGPKASS